MADFILNEMQQIASDKFQEWYLKPETRKRPWFEISGAAGTGKTTVVKHIIQELGLDMREVIFMAFVGKAALALRLSGVDGRTVHSVIYQVVRHYKRDEYGNIVYKYGEPVIEFSFEKNEQLPDYVKLLVVDEGGMIAEDMGRDILSFGIPTLVLGDLHQLPPVFGNSLFLQNPDVCLNKIMRQSKDSSIIYLSQLATYGFDIQYGNYNDGESMVIRKEQLTDEMLRKADLIICNRNTTRDRINWYMREFIYGIKSSHLEIGDKVICRQNCWEILLPDKKLNVDIALVNGLIGRITDIGKNLIQRAARFTIDFQPEFSEYKFSNLLVNPSYALKPFCDRKDTNTKFTPEITFELGYCTTCHLAQGSQYPTVLVYVDINRNTADEYYRKWLYTAITRAQKNLIIVF